MNPPHERIELTATPDLEGVQAFYAEVGYSGGARPGDRLLVAHAEQSIVAAVRLCTEGGVLVLRGMYVAEPLRSQGIGSRLLEFVSGAIGSSECWCIPYTHLVSFYSRIGFRLCEGGAIPRFLRGRRRRYTGGGQLVAIMRRPAR